MPAKDSGLCGTCRFARTVRTQRGSTFLLCERSRTDPAFARYPVLPVIRCRGYADGTTGPRTGPPGHQ